MGKFFRIQSWKALSVSHSSEKLHFPRPPSMIDGSEASQSQLVDRSQFSVVSEQIPGKLQVAHAQMPACIKGSYSPCTIADDSKPMVVCSQVLRRSSEKFSDGRQQFYGTICFLRPSLRFSRTFKELRAIFRNSRIFKVLEKSFQNSRTFKVFKDPFGLSQSLELSSFTYYE